MLLGNGFSVSWNPTIFSYKSLKESASSLKESTKELFLKLNTVDFEEVIKAYEHAADVCEVYKMENTFKVTAKEIRSALIETIASSHPESPASLTESEYNLCIDFLSNFHSIYTLNYEMLLYWVIMKDKFREDGVASKLSSMSDGFAYNHEDFLNWDGSKFDIHYLHGALHLFEHDELVKLNYRNTQIKLKDQFIELIQKQEKLPLSVAEGTKIQKLKRIRGSGYLTRCLNSLQKIGAFKVPKSVFIFGASRSDNDLHIVQALAKNNCHIFYVGVYGDPKLEANLKLKRNAEKIGEIKASLGKSVPFNLKFFDSSTAVVWR